MDIIYTLARKAGHEQVGQKTDLLVRNYNSNAFIKSEKSVCMITNTAIEYPFHVELPERLKIMDVIMCDQLKPMDIQ